MIKFIRLISILFMMMSLMSCSTLYSSPPIQYEYATFTVEIAGDFVTPISADSPEKYSVTTENDSFDTTSEAELWHHLGIPPIQIFSYNQIEVAVINHFSRQGWELAHYDVVTAVSVRKDLHTGMRYIFRRPI